MSTLREAVGEALDYWGGSWSQIGAMPPEAATNCLACGSKWTRFDYFCEVGIATTFTRRVWCWECGHHRAQVWSPDAGEDWNGAWIEDGDRSDIKPVSTSNAREEQEG